MQNLTTVIEKARKLLQSHIGDDSETKGQCNLPDDICPFEYFMDIPNRMKIHKFFEDIRIGDIVFGNVSRISNSKLEMSLICTSGTLIRDICNLNIPATCLSNELPAKSASKFFRRGDIVKCIVIGIQRNESVKLSMNHLNSANKLHHTDLGLYSSDQLPVYHKKFNNYNDISHYFYDHFQTKSLSNSMEIRDRLKLYNFKTDHFSLLDVVNRIDIKPEETAKSLRNTLLMKESKKFVVKGVEYYKQKKYTEALQCYNHALSINEANVDALVARGALRATLKSFELSIADLEKAVRYEPTHKNAAVYLSKTIIAYSKSLPKTDIEKAELLVKKQLLLENEINQCSKTDITNPDNFIVISDDELSSRSKSPIKTKARKRKHKKQKKFNREKQMSDDLSSSDQSSKSPSSLSDRHLSRLSKHKKYKRNSSHNKKAKRKRSLSSSSNLSQLPKSRDIKHCIDLDRSTTDSQKRKRSLSTDYQNQSYPTAVRGTHSIYVDYKHKVLEKGYNKQYSFTSNHSQSLKTNRNSENSINFHADTRLDGNITWRDSYYKRKSTNNIEELRSKHSHAIYSEHTKFHQTNIRSSAMYKSHSQSLNKKIPDESTGHDRVNQYNGNNKIWAEENSKLKAADEEIRKIEDFISQLKNNIKP